jgi:hypothetical protein
MMLSKHLPLAVYIQQDAYIPIPPPEARGIMSSTTGLPPGAAAPPAVVVYTPPPYVLDPQPVGSLACLDAW